MPDFFVLALHEIQSLESPVAKPFDSHPIDRDFTRNRCLRERDTNPPQNRLEFDEFTPICYNKYSKEILFESLDFSLSSLKTPWLQASERLAPCSQLVAKTKKTPFYGPLTSGFAVHCVYSGLPISHGNRPNVPKPTRKNNFRRVQLPSAPKKDHRNSDRITVVFCYEKLWLTIIDMVTVHADGRMTSKFQGGTEIDA